MVWRLWQPLLLGGVWLLSSGLAPAQSTAPLQILTQPQSQTGQLGGTVVFQVTAAGPPPLLYQWRLNGVNLPGRTNTTLPLSNLAVSSGGSFTVVVFNDTEAITSESASLTVRAATGPSPADLFANRPTLTAAQGVVQGNSVLATNEPGEPLSPGGGQSVWCQWFAAADGILTLNSRGSAFDTLLGVYTGTVVSNLAFVASDDDAGGFYTSLLRCNVRQGTFYQFMLDGFSLAGTGGEFTLSLSLETTSDRIPVILDPPLAQAVRPGSNATFRAEADILPVTHQWFFQNTLIPGATNESYTVTNAQPAHVGFYVVILSNRWGRTTKSAPVDLQLNSVSEGLVQDKFENLYLQPASAGSGGGGNRPSAGFISIGLGGTVMTNHLYAQGGGGEADPNPCGSPFVGTLWLGLTATNNGVLQVETTGSAIPARLGVYRLTGGIGDFNAAAFICDLTNGPQAKPCVVRFNAQRGTNYTVVVEGWQTNGLLKLTTRMGVAPPVVASTQCLFVALGGSVPLAMPATNWVPVPQCQWRRNGLDLPGATNTTLLLTNFTAMQAGTYSVVMSNFVSVATNVVANVALAGPFLLSYALATNNGSVGFVISGTADQPVVLESAASLGGPWTPLRTNKSPCVKLVFTNANALLDARRFFRASLWPPAP